MVHFAIVQFDPRIADSERKLAEREFLAVVAARQNVHLEVGSMEKSESR